jgi:hypothetical protein
MQHFKGLTLIKTMKIVELVLDEMQLANGIDAISIVESPAIESNFIALNSQKVEFKAVDEDKRILLGPALIPNKPIYRNQDNEEFYVYFSKATIEKASQLYLKRGNQAKATLEHQISLAGLTLVESWIKVDMEKDKSAAYGLNDPIGTWYVSMKVDNEEIWTEFVKTGKVKGFSIEGFFADKSTEMTKVSKEDIILSQLRELLSKIEH